MRDEGKSIEKKGSEEFQKEKQPVANKYVNNDLKHKI
jgi:hypothetical protein